MKLRDKLRDIRWKIESKINELSSDNTIQWKEVSTSKDGAFEANNCAGYERALNDVKDLLDRISWYCEDD